MTYTFEHNDAFGLFGAETTLRPPKARIGPKAREVFTQGQCHSFAVALQRLVGGHLLVELFPECDAEACPDLPCDLRHVWLQVGDRLYDVRGRGDWDTDGPVVGPISAEELADWADAGELWPFNAEAAEPWARVVARRWGLLA